MNVVEFPTGNPRDIVGMLRKVADNIEADRLPMPERLIVVAQRDDLSTACYCFGDAQTRLQALGVLQVGIHAILADL